MIQIQEKTLYRACGASEFAGTFLVGWYEDEQEAVQAAKGKGEWCQTGPVQAFVVKVVTDAEGKMFLLGDPVHSKHESKAKADLLARAQAKVRNALLTPEEQTALVEALYSSMSKAHP